MVVYSQHLRRSNPRKNAVEEEPKQACFVGVTFGRADEARGGEEERFWDEGGGGGGEGRKSGEVLSL